MVLHREFPLQWPAGWSRTPESKIDKHHFKATGIKEELQELVWELQRLGASRDIIVSTNSRIRQDGEFYTSDKVFDHGVAVYFTLNGQRQCMPCDRWGSIAHNVHAITLSIQAIRGLERWGSRQVVDAAFAGFAALPAPGKAARREWWQVLELDPSCNSAAAIKAAYSMKAKTMHPDRGGTQSGMSELNVARDEAMKVATRA